MILSAFICVYLWLNWFLDLIGVHLRLNVVLHPEQVSGDLRGVHADLHAAEGQLSPRRGESLVGRKAVVIWLLAGLLHGPALGNDLDGFATPSLPEAVATLGQVVASVSALALTLLAISPLRPLRPWRTPNRRVGPARVTPHASLLDGGSGLGFLPRPPPRS